MSAKVEFGWISVFGVVIIALIMIPNVIYACRGRESEKAEIKIPKALAVCEQIGRYGCMILMCLPLFTGKFGFKSSAGFSAYLFINGALIVAYYVLWVVYMKKKTLKTGLALAVIPAAIFLVSGLLLRHWCLVAAAVCFGYAHLKITYLTHSAQYKKE